MSSAAHGVSSKAIVAVPVQAAGKIVSEKQMQSIAHMSEKFVMRMCMNYAAQVPEDDLKAQTGWPIYEMVRRMAATVVAPELKNFAQLLLHVRKNPGTTAGELDLYIRKIFAGGFSSDIDIICRQLESLSSDISHEKRNYWVVSHSDKAGGVQVGILWSPTTKKTNI